MPACEGSFEIKEVAADGGGRREAVPVARPHSMAPCAAWMAAWTGSCGGLAADDGLWWLGTPAHRSRSDWLPVGGRKGAAMFQIIRFEYNLRLLTHSEQVNILCLV